VAMELIEGGTLGEWVERTKPRPREVIAAFVAAGRGLAAAHAEGLVHRDFKPSNVLRSGSGRIVVTDFGLARADGVAGRSSRPAVDPRHSSTAATLTETGSLLGTPAYMAPEQWRFESVTPATDQFAFCVALWEALSGKRPFRGATLDELRDDILDGPVELDERGLPRRLRPVLRRGLAVDPAKRWASMSDLIDAILRATSRRAIAVMAGGGLAAAGLALYLGAGSTTPGLTCAQPALDPDSVTLTAGAAPYVDGWRTARASACEARREVRGARLACLDGVFARIADAFHDRSPGPDALADELVDPSVCGADPPPHLLTTIDGRLASAFAVLAQAKDTWRAIDSELAADTQPPCVRAVALLAGRVGLDPSYDPAVFGKVTALFVQLETAAAACNDDAIKAQVAFATYTGIPNSIRRAEQAGKQFPSDANLTALAAIHADLAVEAARFGEALVAYEDVRARHAAAGRTHAEVDAALELMTVRLERSNPEDLDALMVLAERYGARARAIGRGPGVVALVARARWRLGQVDAANLEARTAGSAYSNAALIDGEYARQDVHGTVVDERGRPVANAKVVAAARLWGDDAELSSPVAAVATTVETTTKADGTFELVGARKMAMASLGDQVSLPVALAPSMTLRIGPTSTVEGDVALGSEPFSRVRVAIFIYGDKVAQLHAGPVDRAGHFKLVRIPRGHQQIAAMLLDEDSDTAQDLDVTQPVLTGVRVRLHNEKSSNKVLYIIGRSETETPPDAAMAFVLRGAHPNLQGTVRELPPLGRTGVVALSQRDAGRLAPAFAGHVEADDLTGELPDRPDEVVTICAAGLSKKLLSTITSPDAAVNVLGDGEVGCVVVSPNEPLVVVTIPAVKRR
ncbi:MAG: serine/threonine-protein kinase, partial [Proteobacteria bacterium]|nr:serine/threonine-protein kinase [Pseudomonadota bacterium]